MTVQATPPIPKGWVADAHHHWLSGRKQEAVQAVLKAINARPVPLPHQPAIQFTFYLCMLGDWSAAAEVFKVICATYPEDLESLKNLGTCLSRSGDLSAAYSTQQRVLSLQPGNYGAWDSMATICHGLRLQEEAAHAGRQSLMLKDALSPSTDGSWSLPDCSPSDFARRAGKTSIVSFSLWGNKQRYLRGALRNALLVPDLYPGWNCRFYIDASVPAEFADALDRLNAEVIVCPADEMDPSNRQRLMRRFKVANDRAVGYFLVRDCDSVVNMREALAVQEWQASGKWFHVMRDWWSHTELMLAGMWGGVAGVLPDLQQMADSHVSPTMETPLIDQLFLRDCVWKYVRQSCLSHDDYFKNFDARPMPRIPGDSRQVGIDEFAVDKDQQARLLGPWIDKLSCLRESHA